VLVAAYDDAAGVTAVFNKNILWVLNAELGAPAPAQPSPAHSHDHGGSGRPERAGSSVIMKRPVARRGEALHGRTARAHAGSSCAVRPGLTLA
jgi:Histidine-specific methyltransferase, SAM-dependent